MRLTEHCFAVTGLAHSTGFSVNAGFVIGDGESAVIDSGFNYLSAQTILGYTKISAPQNKIKYLINTEIHSDHTFGNSAFKEEGTEIIASKGVVLEPTLVQELTEAVNKEITPKLRKESGEAVIFFDNTEICNPDIFVEQHTSLLIGGIKMEILLTPGHTNTNISVYVPHEKVIYVGDLIYSKYLPALRPPGFTGEEQWQHWVRSLEKIQELEIDLLVPGHGAICEGARIQEEIERHIKFLSNALIGKREWWEWQ